MATRARVKLGLIGGNIKASRSPALHRIAGRLAGLEVSYDLLIPAELGLTFAEVLEKCADEGYRGVNVTYPFKEAVVARVQVADANIRRLGAVNTVLFTPEGAQGFNTDYSGFAAAYRARFGAVAPGRVVLIGAGGVGRAIGFALALLGAQEVRILDRDASKAQSLAEGLAAIGAGAPRVVLARDVAEALHGADGVVNATPVGMVGYGGTPVPGDLWPGRAWAFDAVYTPVDTQFTVEAAAAGVNVLSGYELFFYQGVQAFEIFTGHSVDAQAQLRAGLLDQAA